MIMVVRVAIRVDYSFQIGSGHFFRCKTLAEKLKKNDYDVVFFSRHLPEFCKEELRLAGFGLVELHSASSVYLNDPQEYQPPFHAPWLQVSASEDADECVQACCEPFDWMIVDHYALDFFWETRTASIYKHLLVIDDLADRRHACDILVDQNCYIGAEKRYEDLVPKRCLCLLGSKYAILREEFCLERKLASVREGAVKRLMIFMGGVDQENYTKDILDALVSMENIQNMHIDVIIGKANRHMASLQTVCSKQGWNLVINTPDMAKYMRLADASVGSVGTANLERFCLGLPTFALSIAHNQSNMLLDCIKQKLLCTLLDGKNLKAELEQFLKNDSQRTEISRQCFSILDGLGTERLLSTMEEYLQPQAIGDLL